jgi:hypothetical protein
MLCENTKYQNTFPRDCSGDRSRLHNEIFVISTSRKILFGKSNKNTEMGGACGTYGKEEYRNLVRKPEGKRVLRRLRSRRENNIKMRLQDIGWGFGWTGLVLDRENWRAFCEFSNEPLNFIKCGKFLDYLGIP